MTTAGVRQHPREALAERNAEAILDAAERLLARGQQTSVSALASEAGLSRPTVYAHFPDRRRVLEALVERTVRQAMATLKAAEPERGPALAALQRLLATGWEEIGRHEAIGVAAAGQLNAEAMRRSRQSGDPQAGRARTARRCFSQRPSHGLAYHELAGAYSRSRGGGARR